jgi:hypothetical protein
MARVHADSSSAESVRVRALTPLCAVALHGLARELRIGMRNSVP